MTVEPAQASVEQTQPPQPPAWLSDDARSYWADLLRHLPDGHIKPADAHAFAMLCNELATYAEADSLVQDNGLTMGDTGTLRNPAIGIRNDAAAAVARWSAYLRITPDDAVARRAGSRRLKHRHEQ